MLHFLDFTNSNFLDIGTAISCQCIPNECAPSKVYARSAHRLVGHRLVGPAPGQPIAWKALAWSAVAWSAQRLVSVAWSASPSWPSPSRGVPRHLQELNRNMRKSMQDLTNANKRLVSEVTLTTLSAETSCRCEFLANYGYKVANGAFE